MTQAKAREARATRVWARAPVWLLVGWVALVATMLSIRHLHAVRLPEHLAYEVTPAFELGGSDWLTVLIGVLVAVPLGALVWFDAAVPARVAPALAAVTLRWRTLLIGSTIGVGVLTFLTLFRPLPDESQLDCPTSRIIHLGSSMGILWNCDSSLFQDVSAHPSHLLEANHPRQARPAYALVGAVLVQTVGRVAGLFGFDNWRGEDARPYLSLVLLNVLVLIAAAALFVRILLPLGTTVALAAALTVPVAFNHVTLEWTLTPHQQVFAMLVPVVTVLVTRRALLEPPGARTALWWGLALGLAANAYGSWLIAVPVIALALWRGSRVGAGRAQRAARVAAFVAGTAAPLVAWIITCRIVAGSYYNHEAVFYRQFVWIMDAAKQGPGELWQHLSSYSLLWVRSILGTRELWLAGAVLAVGVVVAVLRRVSLAPTTPVEKATLWAVAATGVVSLAFLWGIGYYTPRLAITVLPLVLVAAGWVWSRARNPPPAAAAVFAVAWIVPWLV